MDTALWIVQGLLAFAFLMSGTMKVTQPLEKLEKTLGDWVHTQPTRFIGIAEVIGAVGLIVPWLTHIVPILTPIAASALGVLMIGAAQLHVKRQEAQHAVATVVMLLLAAFVAVGRFGVLG